ncbi:hypothetical protein CP061683_0697B, partial [Chlamydia psittaci 06-1683]
NPLLWLVNG